MSSTKRAAAGGPAVAANPWAVQDESAYRYKCNSIHSHNRSTVISMNNSVNQNSHLVWKKRSVGEKECGGGGVWERNAYSDAPLKSEENA